ncbi:MAG: D-arabinono-1,4-lactone oxidase [Flavicella sp.]
MKWTNWSKSFSSYPDSIAYPSSEAELIALVEQAKERQSKIKVIGDGHSCATIGETHSGVLVSLKNYNQVISFDANTMMLKVQAGISLREISHFLDRKKAAMSNLGTIDSQSISGAISTGTHGSGLLFGAVDQQVECIELINANGALIEVSKTKNTELFNTIRVGLGAFGIISSVTIKAVPKFNLEVKTRPMSFKTMLKSMDLVHKADYMRFWWVPHTENVQYWEAQKTDKTVSATSKFNDWFYDIFLGNVFHEIGLWITSFIPKKVKVLNRLMSKWLLESKNVRIGTSHSMFTIPIHVKQSVMEYGIPIEHTPAVMEEIKTLIESKNYNVHMPIEVRFAPKNDALLSMGFGRETCYIGIISYKPFGKNIPHDDYYEGVHNIFAKYEGRPHWAKKHFYKPSGLVSIYPEWKRFADSKKEFDPNGMFENDYLRNLFPR